MDYVGKAQNVGAGFFEYVMGPGLIAQLLLTVVTILAIYVIITVIEKVVDEAIAATCAEAVGVLRKLHEGTLDYARQRKQFGTAIANFQVLQHRMVDMFMKKESITGITNMAMEYVSKDAVKLADGRELPFKYAMVVPPFLGVDAVRSCDTISNAAGFVPVRDTYQTKTYDNVYAVGLAAAVQVPWTTPVAVGVPKTGFPTEIQAHVAAANIASQIAGLVPTREKPFSEIPALCVMDAGNNGIMLLGDHMLKPRRAAMLIPGPQNHAIKVGLEKYFLWKSRTGRVNLP